MYSVKELRPRPKKEKKKPVELEWKKSTIAKLITEIETIRIRKPDKLHMEKSLRSFHGLHKKRNKKKLAEKERGQTVKIQNMNILKNKSKLNIEIIQKDILTENFSEIKRNKNHKNPDPEFESNSLFER